MKKMIKILNTLFAVVTAFLLGLLLVIGLQAIVSGNYHLQFDIEGIQNFIHFWEEYDALLKVFAGVATIYIAGYNLSMYIDIAAIEALSNIRSRFNEKGKKDFHLFLMKEESDYALALKLLEKEECKGQNDNTIEFDSADILDYLGVIELGYIMYVRRIIDIDEFYNQFGYRVEYLLENKDIVKHILDSKEYYSDFISMVNELCQEGKISAKYMIN